ncbi:hypothetical protein Acry_3168 (plasmid) [Acidiphilium cryptum JF-5]|uniref:Uncharacterized protein n=1 Tax=Acidiphilium cryptum (strain JF-5) TaxID=349163 RepID=A5FT59_ACICJ|nr:hypothetical protein Acry_3168 [Acidiphilium cryptum JF-5]
MIRSCQVYLWPIIDSMAVQRFGIVIESEDVVEVGKRGAVAVLAEGAGAGFAVHQDVEGEAAQSGDDARVGSDPGSILCEGDVSDIVGGIFDAPMCADGLGGDGGGEGCVGDVEGGVVCQLEQAGFGIAGGDCALDLNDGGDMGMPVGAGDRAGTMIFYTIVVGLLILAIDRVEAIADTRALILLGVGVAAMFVLWPNAIYWVAPTLIVLPLASREMNSISAAVALFTIVLLPGFIVVSSMILSGAMFGRPPAEAIAVWNAILHGAAPQEVLHSAWLASFGGQFAAAFVALALMCATIAPRSWLIIWRLGLNQREQTQPATALAALLLPPISGALATYFWHLNAPMVVVACSLAAVASWTATASLRHGERAAWVLLSLAGTSFGWAAPFLWQDSGLAQLRHILLT